MYLGPDLATKIIFCKSGFLISLGVWLSPLVKAWFHCLCRGRGHWEVTGHVFTAVWGGGVWWATLLSRFVKEHHLWKINSNLSSRQSEGKATGKRLTRLSAGWHDLEICQHEALQSTNLYCESLFTKQGFQHLNAFCCGSEGWSV